MFKHDGEYYVITSGCTGWAPNTARLAVADSIWGPWKELGNPCRGPDAATTFGGQSAFVLPVAGRPGTFIFIGDRWNKTDLSDSRYLWLPLRMTDAGFEVEWREAWKLEAGEQGSKQKDICAIWNDGPAPLHCALVAAIPRPILQ